MSEYDLFKPTANGATVDPKQQAVAISKIEELKTKYADIDSKAPPEIKDEDIRTLRRYLLYVIPDDQLAVKYDRYLDEYTKNADPKTAKRKEEAVMEALNTNNYSDLRRLLTEIVAHMNDIIIARYEVTRQRKRLSTTNLLVLLLAMALFSTMLIFSSSTTILYVFVAGVIGGALSVQIRIIMTDGPIERWVRVFEDGGAVFSIFISAIIGGIGAILVYGFLLSKVVTIQLVEFEAASAVAAGNGTLATGLTNLIASKPTNIAWLLVISIAAGWTERIIPDFLNRVGTEHLKFSGK